MKKELYFNGYGYLTIDTDNVDIAIRMLETAMENAGVEFNINEFELRDID